MSESKEEGRLLRALTKGKVSNPPSNARLSRTSTPASASSSPQSNFSPQSSVDLIDDIQAKRKNLTSIVGRARDVLDDLLDSLRDLKSRERELTAAWEERERTLAQLNVELNALETESKMESDSVSPTTSALARSGASRVNDFDLDSLLDDLTVNTQPQKTSTKEKEEQNKRKAEQEEAREADRRKMEAEKRKRDQIREEETRRRRRRRRKRRGNRWTKWSKNTRRYL